MSDFAIATLGQSVVGRPFPVTAERIAAYAVATNDESASCRRGDVAPAVFAFVPLRPVLRALLKEVSPLYEQLKGLHGEQDILVHEPIRPGMELTSRGEVAGIHSRSSGVAVIIRLESRDAADRLVNEHHTTIFFPGADLDRSVGIDTPDHSLPAGLGERPPDILVTQQVDTDQPRRYAEASGDTGRYHLDEQAALSAGLPGIIVHGMCTMAFAGRAVVGHAAGGDPSRLRRLAVRFARPVLPGETLTTSIWALAGPGESALETRNMSGEVVLANGRAEVE